MGQGGEWKGAEMKGEQLKALKNKANLSNRKLAEMTGISESTLSRIFSSDSEPKFDDVVAIVRVTGGSLDEIAGLKPVTDEEVVKLRSQVDTQRIQLANYDNIIKNYDKLLAEKDDHNKYLKKIIRWTAIALGVVLVVFMGIAVYDVANGSIGWARYAEAARNGTSQVLSIITSWINT